MSCDDVEEARDLLRHKNSNVTASIYRAHFSDRRRELLRARMEARVEATDRSNAQQADRAEGGQVIHIGEAATTGAKEPQNAPS